MSHSRALGWQEPLDFAQAFAASPCVLLYSGMRTGYSGQLSWFAHSPTRILSSEHFATLAPELTEHLPAEENAWLGYLGYELLHDLEQVTANPPSFIAMPPLWMAQFAHLYRFDHDAKTLTHYYKDKPSYEIASAPSSQSACKVTEFRSNMSKSDYLSKAASIINAIHAGEFYQANLTRKFYGQFSRTPDAFHVFRALCDASPAPYSAYINTGEACILSSSPERFISLDAQGNVESRPIKGTAPRIPGEPDAIGRARLSGSAKDRAENLMIVDLMRNDLARGCMPGSVEVRNLFEVATYATLHHMDSTITGRKRSDVTPLELVKACFPPGSMTGAPKIRAMQRCAELESIQRGVYSGALGWFGGDGSCDLSVVIRTLIIQETCFEFQVGGGIVAESDPEAEWRETLVKAQGICNALGIKSAELEIL